MIVFSTATPNEIYPYCIFRNACFKIPMNSYSNMHLYTKCGFLPLLAGNKYLTTMLTKSMENKHVLFHKVSFVQDQNLLLSLDFHITLHIFYNLSRPKQLCRPSLYKSQYKDGLHNLLYMQREEHGFWFAFD